MTRAIQPHKNISYSFETQWLQERKKEKEKFFQHFYVIVNKTNNETEKKTEKFV